MTRKLKIVVSRTRVPAVALSPASTAKKMAKGIVCVLPGMLPATISVAPNSPRARAKESTIPETIPGQARGRVIVKKTRGSVAPSVLAASSSV
jgi:hypothetical protein